MSHNLVLRSLYEEFLLVQTPTDVTRAALSSGSVALARATYELWLRGCSSGGLASYDDDNDYAPGWSFDPVTRHVAMIDAFIAFAGAKFYST